MRDKVIYEYVIELKDVFGDIMNLLFYDNLKELYPHIPDTMNYDIALVRTTGNDNEGVKDKSYAYFINGKLPDNFDDGFKVPQKYLKECLNIRR
jgi:hypothetical protein